MVILLTLLFFAPLYSCNASVSVYNEKTHTQIGNSYVSVSASPPLTSEKECLLQPSQHSASTPWLHFSVEANNDKKFVKASQDMSYLASMFPEIVTLYKNGQAETLESARDLQGSQAARRAGKGCAPSPRLD